MNLTEPVQKMQKRCMSECCAKLFQAWCGIIFINGSFLVSAGSGGEQVETRRLCSNSQLLPPVMLSHDNEKFYRSDPRTMKHLRKFVTTVRCCLHVFLRWLGNVKARKDVCNCCIQQICDFAQLKVSYCQTLTSLCHVSTFATWMSTQCGTMTLQITRWNGC